MGIYTFRKEERLNKEKHIQELFKRGSSFYLYPFKVVKLIQPDASVNCHQILISVSVRNFKKAVDRNLIKRRIREAYRLNKVKIQSEQKMMIAYIYTAKEIMTFDQIQEKLLNTFRRLN